MNKNSQVEKSERITQVLVIGTSAGGLNALVNLIGQLSKDFPLPILVVVIFLQMQQEM